MTNLALNTKSERLQNIRLRDNLLYLMKCHDTNMTLIYKHTGVPITTIQRICKDPNANPTLASLIPIADYFSITLAQLIGDEPLPEPGKPNNSKTLTYVPIISWQQAVNWPKFKFNGPSQRQVTTDVSLSEQPFALEILDDHLDSFHKGTQLIIDTQLKPNHGDYVISHKKGSHAASLNQILLHEGDIYLKPTSSQFKTTLMSELYSILGVVVQARMNLKG